MRQVQVIKTIFVGLLLASCLPAKVELEAIHLGPQAEGTFDLSRACTLGFRPLKEFFRKKALRFDPKLVHSSHGRYCHLYYEPTVPGFEADKVSASWIAGSVNGVRMLLVPKLSAQLIVEDDLPAGVSFMLSKFLWRSSELELFKTGRGEQSSVMIYGEAARGQLGRAIRDEEYEYLLKAEFGVDAVKKQFKAH